MTRSGRCATGRRCLSSGGPMRWVRALAGALLGAWASVAAAHPTLTTAAVVTVRADGRVTVSVRHDVLAFALNDTSANVSDAAMYELLNGPDQGLADALEEARRRFARLFVLAADGAAVEIRIN